VETESENATNFCLPYKTRILDQGENKTTWIPLEAEQGEEQENNEDHLLY